MSNKATPGSATAIQPDTSMKGILGDKKALGQIFSKEKMENCQKIVEEAKVSFFDVVAGDMIKIEELSSTQLTEESYRAFYEQLFQPLSNIKGQAEIFGFKLVANICKYLMEYSEQNVKRQQISKSEIFITTQLVKALRHCFNEQITDKDGKLEKQLAEIKNMAKRS
ncbi:MAG: hypothetical protein AB7L92_07840 [Alphaproteobacteria bacterium]